MNTKQEEQVLIIMMNIRNATRRHEHKHSLLKSRRPYTYSDISVIFEEIDGVSHLQLRIDDTTSPVIDFLSDYNSEALR